MIKDYLNLGFSNISQRKMRSWLTMIGIFIGIAAVVALIGLGEGLRVAITSQFGFLGTDIISVQASGIGFAGPPGSGVVDPLSNELADKFKRISGVESAFNRYISTVRFEFNNKQEIGYVGSMPEGQDRKIIEKMLNVKLDSGRELKESDNRKIMVGNSYSDKDLFGKSLTSGSKVLIEGKTFEVTGVIEKKGSFLLDSIVFMNEDDVLDLIGDDGTTDIIAIKVKDENKITQIKEDIEKILRKERDVKEGEENFQVSTPQQTLDSLNSSLFAVRLFVYIIAFISILVGGIGIMNTMYTSVLERRKEIGIMKAIGAKNINIFSIFFIESGFLGMVGGIIGVSIGVFLAYGGAAAGRKLLGIDLIQAYIPPSLIIGALLFSFILGTFFGILPAKQASKLHPVEALRK